MVKGKILLVLSEISQQHLITEYLENAGFQIVAIENYPDSLIKDTPDSKDITALVVEAPFHGRPHVTKENMEHILLLIKDYPDIPLVILHRNANGSKKKDAIDFLKENNVPVNSIIPITTSLVIITDRITTIINNLTKKKGGDNG